MRSTAWGVAVAGVLGGAVVLAGAETPAATDDLAVVKQAVARNEAAAPAREVQEAKPAPRARSAAGEPQWFKVRVVDKATGKKKVTVNMPLTLVRALGDDLPVDWPCDGGRVRSRIKVSEVLAALEAGQDLVQVDDEDSEVRVWVE